MSIVGLTGPTGAGKSFAASVALSLGFQVIDCDLYARYAVEKGSEGLNALVSVFGKEILNEDGTLNRNKTAEIAFKNKDNTDQLNKTLLPYIVALVKKDIKSENVILDAPTLFESGLSNDCSFTVSVLADTDIRKSRIMKRDSLTEAEAMLRISAGKPDSFYIDNSDFIIYNNADNSTFKEEFINILKRGNDL